MEAKRNKAASKFRVSDALWERLEPLLPPRPSRDPRKGGRPPRSDRECADAIFFVLRTGCQWNALSVTGLCPSSTAHDRFQEWVKAGVFERLWQSGLKEYDELKGIDWTWLSLDGAQTKAPLGGEKKPARTPPTEASSEPSAASCARPGACPWRWPSREPTAMT